LENGDYPDLEKYLSACYPTRKSSEPFYSYLKEGVGVATRGQDMLVESKDGRYLCALDGYIRNHEPIDAELREKNQNVPCRSAADTLLNSFLENGPEVFKRFQGGFVAAIIDTKKKEIRLARDNFGLKVIYYIKAPGGFMFSSNLTGLVRSVAFDRKIDLSGFIEYMACGYISAPWTIYEKVASIRPGEQLVYKDNITTVYSFSDYEISNWSFHDIGKMTEDGLVDKLDALLSSTIRQRLPNDKKIAVYLSGGHDTSLLCAELKENAESNIVSYTLGFRDRSRDEIPQARAFAQYLNIEHNAYYLTKDDSMEAFPLIPDIYGQPFADVSAIPTYVIASKVSEQFDSIFLGDGPDFLFGTYDMRLLYFYYKFVPSALRKFSAVATAFLTNNFFKKYMTPNLDVPELVRQPHLLWTFTRMFKGKDLEKLVGEPIYPETFWTQRFIEGRPDIPLAERLRLAQYLCYGISSTLYKSCCVHDANLLKFQCPFYDPELVKFIQFLPTKFKFKRMYGKYLQKQLLYRKFPREMIDRPKRGFMMDFKELGEGTIKHLADQYLTKKRLNETGLINADFALKCVDDYFKGDSNMGPKMWTLLIFELWREKFSI